MASHARLGAEALAERPPERPSDSRSPTAEASAEASAEALAVCSSFLAPWAWTWGSAEAELGGLGGSIRKTRWGPARAGRRRKPFLASPGMGKFVGRLTECGCRLGRKQAKKQDYSACTHGSMRVGAENGREIERRLGETPRSTGLSFVASAVPCRFLSLLVSALVPGLLVACSAKQADISLRSSIVHAAPFSCFCLVQVLLHTLARPPS